MQRFRVYCQLLFLIIAFACSCRKEATPYLSIRTTISSTKWQLDRLLVEYPPGSARSDITSGTYKPCELDDLFSFKTDGIFHAEENVNVCIMNASIFHTLNQAPWVIAQGDTILTIGAGRIIHSFRIGPFSNHSLELLQFQKNYLDEDMVFVFQFKSAK